MRRHLFGLLVATAAVSLLGAACGDDSDDTAEDPAERAGTEVGIDDFTFAPDPFEVPAGTSVAFVNNDDVTHTVTEGTRDAPGDEFDETLDGGASTEITFDEPGTYEYFCALHGGEGMSGQIVVTD